MFVLRQSHLSMLVITLLAGCGKSASPPAAPPSPITRTFRSAADERAYSAANMKQLSLAIMQFGEKNGDKFPDMSTAETLRHDVLPFVLKNGGNENIFTHPRTGEPYQPNSSLSGKSVIDYDQRTAILFEASPTEGGTRGVIFADGHYNRVAESEWPALKQVSGIP